MQGLMFVIVPLSMAITTCKDGEETFERIFKMKRYEKRNYIIEIENATSLFKSVKANAASSPPLPLCCGGKIMLYNVAFTMYPLWAPTL